MRRGLTLIEVVAATALLSLVVLACVPVLRAAASDVDAARAVAVSPARERFERAADDLLAQRPNLAAQLLASPGGLTVEWRCGDVSYAAEARLLLIREADDRRTGHAWISISARGIHAVRWVRTPAHPPAAGAGA